MDYRRKESAEKDEHSHKEYTLSIMYNMAINDSQVIATWGQHLKESLGITDESKLQWMSKYAYLHDLHDKKMIAESVDGHAHLNPNMNIGGMGAIRFPDAATNNTYDRSLAGSGDNVYSVLPLALQVAAQTIALDLVPVVPMQGPHGLLQYLDYVYEGGRLHNQGGSEYTSPLYNGKPENFASPYMIKANITMLEEGTGTDPVKHLYRPNMTYHFKDNDDYELTYIYPNRIDGKPLFRVVEKSHYNGQKMVGGENASTPIYVLFENLMSDGSNKTTLVRDAYTDEKGVKHDEMELICDGVGTNAVENVRAFEDHVTSFSGEGFLKKTVTSNNPYTREMGEATPGRKIGLKSYTLDIKAMTLKVDSAITREQVQDLKQFGIDAVSQAEAALVNELTQGINKIILEKMFNLGALNATQLQEVEGRNLISAWFVNGQPTSTTDTTTNIWLGDKYNKETGELEGKYVAENIPYTNVTGGGEVMGTIQRRIMTKIIAASNVIAVRGRRGAGTFAVCSGTIGTALQDCAGFMPYPLSNTISANGNSLYPIGALAGISIYVDPNMAFNDMRVVVGRKGKENEPGIVFCPYLMADKVETTSEFTMAPVISLQSRFACVEAGIYPQTQYYTFAIKLDGVSLV